MGSPTTPTTAAAIAKTTIMYGRPVATRDGTAEPDPKYKLKNNNHLDKTSLIRLAHTYILPLNIFQTYSTSCYAKSDDLRLVQASFYTLLHRMGIEDDIEYTFP